MACCSGVGCFGGGGAWAAGSDACAGGACVGGFAGSSVPNHDESSFAIIGILAQLAIQRCLVES